MTAVATTRSDPLAPVRESLLSRARAEADRVLADADAGAASILDGARAEADRIVATARAEGEADAAVLVGAARARARRRARALLLAARRGTYDDLRDRVLAAAPGLCEDPAYAPWRERLVARARAELGVDAEVSEHPEGGVIALAGARRAEYTLAGLAEQAVEALGADLESLWSS
ncbi:MAG TPA: hypothetical protein VLA97_14790 [Nocardioidaceae bacterium]|nr:hypothetical protein [Nocardioidaceae bacterium]